MSREPDVLASAEDIVRRCSQTHAQRRLLFAALRGVKARPAEDGQRLPYVDLPLLVYGALCGDDGPAIPLAAATTLLYLGVDILDDLQDDDLPEHWQGHRPAEVDLAAATLLSAVVPLAITELKVSDAALAAMQRALARGLLRMSAGQQQDLATAGSSTVSAAAVEESVAAKSGEELALFATLAALMAGAAPELVETYAEMARAMGTAGQLASDCHDLFVASRSCDLANGTRTLPIALHFERLTSADRLSFLDLLGRAVADPVAKDALRNALRASGALWHSAFTVEVHCQKARRALERANPLEPAAGRLRAMIDSISFFPKGASE